MAHPIRGQKRSIRKDTVTRNLKQATWHVKTLGDTSSRPERSTAARPTDLVPSIGSPWHFNASNISVPALNVRVQGPNTVEICMYYPRA